MHALCCCQLLACILSRRKAFLVFRFMGVAKMLAAGVHSLAVASLGGGGAPRLTPSIRENRSWVRVWEKGPRLTLVLPPRLMVNGPAHTCVVTQRNSYCPLTRWQWHISFFVIDLPSCVCKKSKISSYFVTFPQITVFANSVVISSI